MEIPGPMPPLIREMLENPDVFEDSSDSSDSATTPTAAAPPPVQAIKQEDKSTYESAFEEEEEEEEDDYWDEEKEWGADSDGEPCGEAAGSVQKKAGKTPWERQEVEHLPTSGSQGFFLTNCTYWLEGTEFRIKSKEMKKKH